MDGVQTRASFPIKGFPSPYKDIYKCSSIYEGLESAKNTPGNCHSTAPHNRKITHKGGI